MKRATGWGGSKSVDHGANTKIRAAVLGASGYTGADLIRLAARHPTITITALIAKGHAGQTLAQVFPHLASLDLPPLVTSDQVDWNKVDVAFCGLPHGTAHSEIAKLPERVKVIDMSADFRLRDAAVYAEWYGGEHTAPKLLKHAVYGLTEHYAKEIKAARLVACPGCYPTAVLLALLPLLQAKLIKPDDVIIDAKSGVSGAGRTLKQNILFAEAGEGLSPYGIGSHRHVPEIEQELGRVAGTAVTVNFTPHLVPMSRGELCTCYVQLAGTRQGRRSPGRARQGLCSEPLRARGGGGRDPGHAACARLEFLPYRRVRRSPQRPRHRGLGHRQSGEGLGRSGAAELQPDAWLRRDARARAAPAVSLARLHAGDVWVSTCERRSATTAQTASTRPNGQAPWRKP